MALAYATADDVAAIYRDLTAQEIARCDKILPLLSDMIRAEYYSATRGDYDAYIDNTPGMESTVKLVICDVCYRFIRTNLQGDSYSQEQQGGLGYTWSGTYAVPGGGIANAFLERDWKRLKVHVPRVRSLEYGYAQRDIYNAYNSH